jgi:outer membrane protein OmpA-like peptidoglycan-associated protein
MSPTHEEQFGRQWAAVQVGDANTIELRFTRVSLHVLVATMVLLAHCLLTTGVQAQTELALDRLQPTPPADLFIATEDPSVPSDRPLWAGQLLTSYAYNPLEVIDVTTNDYRPVIDSRLWFVGQGQLSLLGLLQFDVMLPFVTLNEGRSVVGDQGQYAAPSGTARGDLRLGGRIEALDQDGAWPSVGLSARGWLPTGERDAYTSTSKLRYAGSITIGGDYEHFSYRLAGGRRRQYLSEESDFKLASETLVKGALGYRAGGLVVGPELLLSLASNEIKHRGSTVGNLEALLTGHYAFERLSLRAGVGGALAQRQGTADFRAVLAVVWTSEAIERVPRPAPPPPPPPRDHVSARTIVPELRGGDLERRLASGEQDALPAAAESEETAAVPTVELPVCDGTQSKGAACAPDGDADGIADADDRCPQQPGPASQDGEQHGCPRKALITSTHIELSERIQFETGSATLVPASEQVLSAIAGLLDEHPDIARVAVEGHTDNVGSEDENLALSRARALTVVRWLVERGVDERRLEVRGYGPRRPKASNDTEAGRTENRRVEFTIVRRDPAGEEGWTDGPVDADAPAPAEPTPAASQPSAQPAPEPLTEGPP